MAIAFVATVGATSGAAKVPSSTSKANSAPEGHVVHRGDSGPRAEGREHPPPAPGEAYPGGEQAGEDGAHLLGRLLARQRSAQTDEDDRKRALGDVAREVEPPAPEPERGREIAPVPADVAQHPQADHHERTAKGEHQHPVA